MIQKNAGDVLLESYEQERRPVALTSVQRSRIHHGAHVEMAQFLPKDLKLVEEDSETGRALREKIQQHYTV